MENSARQTSGSTSDIHWAPALSGSPSCSDPVMVLRPIKSLAIFQSSDHCKKLPQTPGVYQESLHDLRASGYVLFLFVQSSLTELDGRTFYRKHLYLVVNNHGFRLRFSFKPYQTNWLNVSGYSIKPHDVSLYPFISPWYPHDIPLLSDLDMALSTYLIVNTPVYPLLK